MVILVLALNYFILQIMKNFHHRLQQTLYLWEFGLVQTNFLEQLNFHKEQKVLLQH